MVELLRHFLAVAETGTFTAAARRVHLTQPALTASIQRLEAGVGAPLFVRGRRGAELTDAGRALMPHARAAVIAVHEGQRAVAETVGLGRGELRVGAGTTAITYLLPPLVAAYRKRHPGVRLALFERGQDALLTAFDAGEVDLAVVTGPAPGAEPFRTDELVLVHAPGIDPEAAPFVSFPVGTASRALLDRHFPGAPIAMELSSASALKGQLRAGLGVALVSRLAVATDLALGRLVEHRPSRGPVAVRRELVLLHRGVSRLSFAARAMRELLVADAPSPPRRSRRRT